MEHLRRVQYNIVILLQLLGYVPNLNMTNTLAETAASLNFIA